MTLLFENTDSGDNPTHEDLISLYQIEYGSWVGLVTMYIKVT